jgi:hypothetical protein
MVIQIVTGRGDCFVGMKKRYSQGAPDIDKLRSRRQQAHMQARAPMREPARACLAAHPGLLQINLARSEWLGKQSSFIKSLHDAIDFSFEYLSRISLIAVRTDKSRDVLDYYYLLTNSSYKFGCSFSHFALA